jgi:hypothetical protein
MPNWRFGIRSQNFLVLLPDSVSVNVHLLATLSSLFPYKTHICIQLYHVCYSHSNITFFLKSEFDAF